MSNYIYTAEATADENYRSVLRHHGRDRSCRARPQKSLSVQPAEKTRLLNGNPLNNKQGSCTHSLGVFVWRAICWQNMQTQHRGNEYEF